jgi:hypothetical protein
VHTVGDPLGRYLPRVHAIATIALPGAAVLFRGAVETVQRRRVLGSEPWPWVDVTCVDLLALFDAHFVTAEYPAQSITTTILDIVDRFVNLRATTGQAFQSTRVQAGLPSAAGFSVTNERPSTIIRRLLATIGGAFYVDEFRMLHAFDAAGEDQNYGGTRPQPLTNTLPTLKTFAWTHEGTQQRNRVWVEGQRTEAPLGVVPWMGAYVPLTDVSMLPATYVETTAAGGMAVRIGSQLFRYQQARAVMLDANRNPPGTTVTVAAAIGAGTLSVASTAMFPAGQFWVQVGNQLLNVNAGTATDLTIIAQPWNCALRAPVAVGTQVTQLSDITSIDGLDRGNGVPVAATAPRLQPFNAPAVLVVWRHRPGASTPTTTTPAIVDGHSEHFVQDGRFSYEGAVQRAATELEKFGDPLVGYQWDTEDLNADVGRLQTIDLHGAAYGQPVADTVLITSVRIVPLVAGRPPRRSVTARKVPTLGVIDMWLNAPA